MLSPRSGPPIRILILSILAVVLGASEVAFAQPEPGPDAKPVPEGQPAPEANPAPAGQPVPEANPAPQANPAPAGQPVPEANPAPKAKPKHTPFVNVWFELLHAPCWTGSEDDIEPEDDNGVIGEVQGAIDCFNKDFNGKVSRTLLSIKAFSDWKYGFVFMYYDVTGPFNRAGRTSITDNEKGGFFGGITVAISPKRIAQELSGVEYDWGVLRDIYVKYEAEHVSKFGMLHYYGLAYDFKIPHLDFVSATTVIRDDRAFEGVDFQIGAAAQKTFSLGGQSIVLGGFFQWGLFGEGDAPSLMTKGNPFFLAQPQLLYDFGKLIKYDPGKIYVGFEYQIAFNRYIISGKTENVLQGMIKWVP